MTYFSPFVGPYSNFPVPDNVIVQEPNLDNTIEIGRPSKRYKTIYVAEVDNGGAQKYRPRTGANPAFLITKPGSPGR